MTKLKRFYATFDKSNFIYLKDKAELVFNQ